MNEIKELLYYALLTAFTVIMIVVLGNRLGLPGIVLAFIVPMAVEILRSVVVAKRRRVGDTNRF